MEAPLTFDEILIYRRRMLEEFARHARGVEALERDALEPSGGARFQDVDESVEETALDVDLATLAAEDELGYEVHEALERIARSTYGVCEDCERPIARQRLDQVPYARQCATCAGASSSVARGTKTSLGHIRNIGNRRTS